MKALAANGAKPPAGRGPISFLTMPIRLRGRLT